MDNYEMYTEAGNRAVGVMVENIKDKMRLGEVTRKGLRDLLKKEQAKVAKRHPEVHDTEPEWHIVDEINTECERQMWLPVTRDDLF